MKRHPQLGARRAWIAAALALSLAVAGCASAMPRQSIEPEPASCTSSSLAELRAQHPDSLSERGWQRLQALERECRLARAAAAREDASWTTDHHALWMASGLAMALIMLVMLIP